MSSLTRPALFAEDSQGPKQMKKPGTEDRPIGAGVEKESDFNPLPIG